MSETLVSYKCHRRGALRPYCIGHAVGGWVGGSVRVCGRRGVHVWVGEGGQKEGLGGKCVCVRRGEECVWVEGCVWEWEWKRAGEGEAMAGGVVGGR